jgi:hypothetical protein
MCPCYACWDANLAALTDICPSFQHMADGCQELQRQTADKMQVYFICCMAMLSRAVFRPRWHRQVQQRWQV